MLLLLKEMAFPSCACGLGLPFLLDLTGGGREDSTC